MALYKCCIIIIIIISPETLDQNIKNHPSKTAISKNIFARSASAVTSTEKFNYD